MWKSFLFSFVSLFVASSYLFSAHPKKNVDVSVEFFNSAEVTISIAGFGGWEKNYFTEKIEAGKTLILDLPRGLMQVHIHVLGKHNEAIAAILDDPKPENIDKQWHKNVIYISDDLAGFIVYGGPKGKSISNWRALQITSEGFENTDEYPYSPKIARKRTWAENKHRHDENSNGFLYGAAIIAGVIGTFVMPAIGLPSVLSVLGFAKTGIVANSFAAFIQSNFYGGATGGLFSILQSMGMTSGGIGLGSLINTLGLFGITKSLPKILMSALLFTAKIDHKIEETSLIQFKGDFNSLKEVIFFPKDDYDTKKRTGILLNFAKSDEIHRYRFEFSKSELDFEVQVPAFSGSSWREFIYMDSKYLIGETLETIYVLEPKTEDDKQP